MNQKYKTNRWQIILAVLMFVSGVAGVALSVQAQGLEVFDAYTENSNIFNLITCSIYLLYLIGLLPVKTQQGIKFMKQMRYISTCCLTLTFVMVLFVLAPMEGLNGYKTMFFSGAMLFNHLLTPLLSFYSFVFMEKEPRLEKKNSLYVLIPTLIYGIITVTLNAIGVLDGPYPFLRVRDQSIIVSIVWVLIIFAVNYAISVLILYLNRKK